MKIQATAALAALAMLLAGSPEANAAEKAAPSKPVSEQPAEGEVDISDVQQQYWKAHDKQFEVIQNRLYTKKQRIEIGPNFGIYQRVDFQDAKTLGLSVAYHFDDMFGVELMGYKIFANDSSILERFKATRNATIEYNKEKFYAGASFLFTPIYAKFSFMGTKISHFDMYLAAGAGAVHSGELRPAVSAALGQKFWVTPKWNLRMEYRWIRYNDKVQTTEGATSVGSGGPGFYESTVNDYNLMLGFSYLFN